MATAEDLFRQALVAHQTGDLDGAELGYRQMLAVVPDDVSSLINLASIIARRGDTGEAEQLCTRAIAAAPDNADAHFNLGNLYRRLGRPRDAATHFEQVLRIAPDAPAALVNLGLAVSDAGDWTRAVECFARVTIVAPQLPDALLFLGDALARCGRRDQAIAAFRESVARFPDAPRGHYNLAIHLGASGALDDAIAAFGRALQLHPDYAEAHNGLGVALEAVGRADDAQREYREAVRLRPVLAEAWLNLGISLGEQGRGAEGADALRRSIELRPEPVAGSMLLANLMYSANLSAEQLRDEHVAWAETHANSLTLTNPPRKPLANKGRVRVGYVTAEFQSRHAIGFLESLLTHHDRNQFHVTVYASPTRSDESLNGLRRFADAWKLVAHLTDDKFANLIRADEIDILVDLNGHIPGNRLLAFARKPAAIQISLFGYPATTGLRAMDFHITDAVTDPPGQAEPLFVERLLRLPDLGWVYAPPTVAPPPNELPAARGQGFTFGSLNHPAKLSDACIEAWAAILKAVPKSRLVLLAGPSVASSDKLAARFTQRGIASDRLELVSRLSANDYIEAYQPLDLALDPFPHGGAATTCDALWMGVPVLTVAGRDARGRQSVAILNALGLPEFVADTPEQLVTLAATWADQRDSLAELRGTLREMMAQSPITAVANYVKQLEAAYCSV